MFEPVTVTLSPSRSLRFAPGLLARLTSEGLRHSVKHHGDGRISVSWDDEAAPVEAVERVTSSASGQIRRRLENLIAERKAAVLAKKRRGRRRRSS